MARTKFQLTTFGRSLLLIVSELLANAACWIVAGVLFGKNQDTQSILSLALLAWVCAVTHELSTLLNPNVDLWSKTW